MVCWNIAYRRLGGQNVLHHLRLGGADGREPLCGVELPETSTLHEAKEARGCCVGEGSYIQPQRSVIEDRRKEHGKVQWTTQMRLACRGVWLAENPTDSSALGRYSELV